MKLAEARLVVIDRDGGACLICGQRFDEIHHRYRRGMGGSSDPEINSPVNLLSLCGFHHRQAESLRSEVAAPWGLCVPNLPAAFLTPVRTTWIGWALPTAGGTWLPICPPHYVQDWQGAQRLAYLAGLLPLSG